MNPILTCVSACAACVVLSAVIAITFGFGLPLGADGTRDFVQYWSAWRLLQQGINPYDAALMHSVQASVGQPPGITTMMWNPPWVPVLLSPILDLPFETAALVWFVCNLSIMLVVGACIPRALGYQSPPLWVYGAGACFLPCIDCLKWGQLSLVHTLGFVLFLYCVRNTWYLLTGVVTALLMSKPHLFVLCIVPGFFWFVGLKKTSRQALIVGAGMATITLTAITLLYCPNAFAWWMEGIRGPTTGLGVVSVREWQTATLATIVRTVIWSSTGSPPDWPLWAFPLLGGVLTAAYFRVRRQPIVWSDSAPALLCLSCLFASYGWFYDQSVLIVSHFYLLCRAAGDCSPRARYVTLAGLAVIQGTIIAINLLTVSAQHYYVWVPAAYLGLIWICSRPSTQSNI